MRKILLFMFVFFATSIYAQKVVDLNRDFSLSGKLWVYVESENAEDAIAAVDGARWHLTNEFVAGRNHVKFWITAPDVNEDMFFTRWSAADLKVIMQIGENGYKNYYINDDVFNNLMILESEDGYIVRKCSVLLNN